ncbi:hypothetical protein THASP1DRAFT_26105 [Thamnocephalis sphaerospora]|uniref:Uncharacterized protein n=1 Tax=Thamnocephalis sphaerospora TaxID=78915 RepID=A0A4P9XI77_9FUNG|nr:hypothetical protein THASP1DRAFT_26105 [Thamnocephalis sphaerospora]|eukprot:RKP05386.1 hypothetical protein THASP1DRAFT_26105 [Thamnocephalis sphaerospora]
MQLRQHLALAGVRGPQAVMLSLFRCAGHPNPPPYTNVVALLRTGRREKRRHRLSLLLSLLSLLKHMLSMLGYGRHLGKRLTSLLWLLMLLLMHMMVGMMVVVGVRVSRRRSRTFLIHQHIVCHRGMTVACPTACAMAIGRAAEIKHLQPSGAVTLHGSHAATPVKAHLPNTGKPGE